MNRVSESLAALRRRGGKAFAPFVMAGYPDMETTERMLRGLAGLGADLIEFGIPFSDPMADGPTNQAASHEALVNGASLDGLLDLAAAVSPDLSCPLVLFTYYNPIVQRGTASFIEKAARTGIAGLIVPDLPPEAAGAVSTAAADRGLGLTFLVAPTSTPVRIELASEASTGFLYAVSVRGVTGARSSLAADLPEFMERVKSVSNRPILVGFGISGPEQARAVASISDGVIVASALVRLIGQEGPEAALKLAGEIRKAV